MSESDFFAPYREAEQQQADAAARLARLKAMIPTAVRPPAKEKKTTDGAQLLADIEDFYRKYAGLHSEAYTIMPPWVLHCHAFLAFTRTPYLHVTSPVPECGKTTLLELTELLVPNPLLTMSMTNAVLARVIERDRPVLLLDEIDQIQNGDKELKAAVMATINSGYKKSGRRTILVQTKGKDWEPKHFSTFCAKALSGIANLDPATQSRCIPIRMDRLSPNEKVQDIDEYVTEPEANSIFGRAEEWAKQNLVRLRDARPSAPVELRNRQREVCRPLLAIADAAGGEWPQRLRQALVELSRTRDTAADSSSIRLLRDIRSLFDSKQTDRLTSEEIVAELVSMEDSPWPEWRGKPITKAGVARLLGKGSFEISPRTIRTVSGTPKGYLRESFENAWTRYLPLETPPSPLFPGIQTATPPQSSIHAGLEPLSKRNIPPGVAVSKSEENPINTRVVADVAVSKRGESTKGDKNAVSGEGMTQAKKPLEVEL